MARREAIQSWCKNEKLPCSEEFYSALVEENGRFSDIEGVFWDFKQEWPFSYSDKYFAGIARLICAFANTEGGSIIFGVHDKSRLGGKNRVRPNLDKLASSFHELTGSDLKYDFKAYEDTEFGAVDALLVLPREINERP